MITNHDPALQPTVAILEILLRKEKRQQLSLKKFVLHDTTYSVDKSIQPRSIKCFKTRLTQQFSSSVLKPYCAVDL